jgi:general secretion pathway protein J
MKRARGFSLIELVVALAVFAALAAAAYGGLAAIARTRGALAAQQDRFAAVTRAVSAMERDLRQTISRPVRGNNGADQPALFGRADSLELTRLGYANPLAEPRSHLERVVYGVDRGGLRRGRYAVLDRAPDSAPIMRDLLARTRELRLRYYGSDGVWRDAWPADAQQPAALPRAVEFRFVLDDLGEIRRVVELPSTLPAAAAAATQDGAPPPPHATRPPPGGTQ